MPKGTNDVHVFSLYTVSQFSFFPGTDYRQHIKLEAILLIRLNKDFVYYLAIFDSLTGLNVTKNWQTSYLHTITAAEPSVYIFHR